MTKKDLKCGSKVTFTGKDSWGITNERGYYTVKGFCSATEAVCKFDGDLKTDREVFVVLPIYKLQPRKRGAV